jgi:hypothetical protein
VFAFACAMIVGCLTFPLGCGSNGSETARVTVDSVVTKIVEEEGESDPTGTINVRDLGERDS